MLGLVNQETVAPQLCAAAGAAPAASTSRAAAAPLASKDEPFVLIKKTSSIKGWIAEPGHCSRSASRNDARVKPEIRLFSAV
jgi:hypothetical protein